MKATLARSRVKSQKADVPLIIRKIRTNVSLVRATLLLVGSMARDTETRWSDIDFLVISEARIPIWIPPLNVHLQFDTRNEFIAGVRKGDDFRAWALRYGKVILDDGWWSQLPREDLMAVWPKWRPKIVHGQKNLRLAMGLAEMGDVMSAWREMIYAVSHIARAVLIAAHEFPLSRPELPGQLARLEEADLANALELLLFKEPNHDDVVSIAHSLEKRVEVLMSTSSTSPIK